MIVRLLSACSLAATMAFSPGDAQAAVVLVYHHVSDQTPPSTSVTPERFEAHLDYLQAENFEVWPVARLLAAAIDNAEPIPPRAVAITFDDAYRSVYETAWPMLRKRQLPFAVFVNTDAVDAGHDPYMDWNALRELHAAGVAIGNHSATHDHLIAHESGESDEAWSNRIRRDLGKAQHRITEEIGTKPLLFAYPYGEDSKALAKLVEEQHRFGLVQRSGAVGVHTDPMAVPRFPMASGFDGLERFSLAVHTRALPVTDAQPLPPGDGVRGPLQSLELKVAEGGYRAEQMACFTSSGSRLDTRATEGSPLEVEIQVDGAGAIGRNKINCTAPASDGSGDFFWYAFQWVQQQVRD